MRRRTNAVIAPPAERRRSGGFTLIELIVVMGIIILALAFMAPTIAKFLQNRKLDSAGRTIVGVLNEARSEAITKRQEFWVVFLQDGVHLYDAAAKELVGPKRRYSRGQVRYDLAFYDKAKGGKNTHEALPLDLYDPSGTEIDPDIDIVLKFTATGTVDFNRLQDVATLEYNDAKSADIILKQDGNKVTRGFIDIRPAGMVSFKIEDIDGAELQ